MICSRRTINTSGAATESWIEPWIEPWIAIVFAGVPNRGWARANAFRKRPSLAIAGRRVINPRCGDDGCRQTAYQADHDDRGENHARRSAQTIPLPPGNEGWV